MRVCTEVEGAVVIVSDCFGKFDSLQFTYNIYFRQKKNVSGTCRLKICRRL